MTLPSDYREAIAEDQRLLILCALAEVPDQTDHAGRLRERLVAEGQRIGADDLRGHLAWLDRAGLIVLLGERVPVVRLTLRGEDVAQGRLTWPGVARVRV